MSDRVEVTGMVLSSVPYGEYDKRIVLLTKERGKISGFVKGARRQNSAMLAPTTPFAFGTFECFEGKSSYNFYSAQISHYFETLSMDFEAAYLGMYFLEFADYYARENNDERELLKLLFVTMRALERKQIEKKLIRSIFELRAMTINGEYPEVFSCAGCGTEKDLAGFSHERNGVLCRNCLNQLHGWNLKEAAVYTLQYMIAAPLEKLYSFTVTEEVYLEVSAIVERFRMRMIDRHFKTLEILDSLQI